VYGVWYAVEANQCIDSDGDGLSDCLELEVYATEIFNPDTDGDGYTDKEEIDSGYSPHVGDGAHLTDVDSDGDGLTDAQELKEGTFINHKDSDNDGIPDGQEVREGTDPLRDNTKEPLTGWEELKSKVNFK
jgi:hypothetical protein